MKKVFLSAALALAVAGSWAFYPKAPAEPGGYMMLVGNIGLISGNFILTTITSDGQRATVPVTPTKRRQEILDLHQAEILKLNQLRQEGWRVVSTTITPTSMNHDDISVVETTYVLEKN